MNLVQELVELEEKKNHVLEQSYQNSLHHYFCFINISPIYRRTKDKSVDQVLSLINFQILSFNEKIKNQFSVIDFNAYIEIQNKSGESPTLSYHYTTSPTVKYIGKNGLFLINNYHDLTDLQKKSYINKVQQEYEKMQDPYDDRAIPRFETRGIVDYLKSDNHDLTLKEFIKEIKKKIRPLVQIHLTSIKYERKKQQSTESSENFSVHKMTSTEMRKLIKDIKTHLVSCVPKSIKKVEVRKDSNYGTSNEWDIHHNNAVEHFIAHDKNVKKLRKQRTPTATKKLQKSNNV